MVLLKFHLEAKELLTAFATLRDVSLTQVYIIINSSSRPPK